MVGDLDETITYERLSAKTRQLYPFSGSFIRVGGHKLHYLDEGEGEREGDVVLMLHGNPTWSFYYRNMVKSLKSQHRVIVPDHIGCGFSDKPGDDEYDYTLQQRVDDIATLVDYLGLKRITLMVHDWGGMIGMALAARMPNKIRHIIASNTAAFHLPASKPMPVALRICRDTKLGALLVQGCNAFSRGAVHTCVKRAAMAPEVKEGYLAPYRSWAERRAVLRFVQDIPLNPDDIAYNVVSEVEKALPVLSQIPTLVVWGEEDFVFDNHFLEDWRRYFPDAEIHSFDGVGHYVLEDAFNEVLPLVQSFLHRTP